MLRAKSRPSFFLLAFIALLGLLFSTSLLAAKYDFKMDIEEVKIHVAPGLDYKVFGFNGQVPGPLIHVKEGDDVTVHVTNNTSLPHTIHWHGLYQTDNWVNDGVPGSPRLRGSSQVIPIPITG